MNQDPTPSAAGQDRRAAVPVRWRVLVADDHPFSRAVIALQLRHLGCGATLVEDGLHALAALERDRYDLLISDCHMPRLDGPALARRIRAGESPGTARLPILAWSGSSSEQALVHWREAGMDDALPKPLRLHQLQHALERHLGAAPPPVPAPAGDLLRQLTSLFGGTAHARQAVGQLLDASGDDLAALDQALAAGDLPLQRRLLHRIEGSLCLLQLHSATDVDPVASADHVLRRDLISLRLGALRELHAQLAMQAPAADGTAGSG